MFPNFALFTTFACAVVSAIPTEPAAVSINQSLPSLVKREASCSSMGQSYNFDRSELQNYTNQLLANPGESHKVSPLFVSFAYKGTNMLVSVQNAYIFQSQTYTNEQLAHALSFIVCCDNNGHCSEGRAVFPSGKGNLVVRTCNINNDKCHDK